MIAALFGFVAGIGLQLQQAFLFDFVFYFVGLVFGLAGCLGLFFVLRFGRSFRFVSVLFFVFAGIFGFSYSGLRAGGYEVMYAEFERQDFVVQGVVSSIPQRSDRGQGFDFLVQESDLPAFARLPARIRLFWYDASLPSLRVGDRWRFSVRLKRPHSSFNPFLSDREFWFFQNGIVASGYVRASSSSSVPLNLGQESGAGYLVDRLRQGVFDEVYAYGSLGDGNVRERARAAGVVAALVMGWQRAIDFESWDIFRATGVSHLVSISGLHITMFAWVAIFFVSFFWRWLSGFYGVGRFTPCLLVSSVRAGLVGGVFLAFLYALFSGFGVPAQRACLMLLVFSALRFWGVEWAWYRVCALAAAVVLLVFPLAFLQAGFWLSFVAVSILFLTADYSLLADDGDSVWDRLFSYFYLNLRQQGIIAVALAPLTVLLFGQFSVVSLLANLVAIPVVTLFVLPLGFLGLVFSFFWDWAFFVIEFLMWFLEFLAGLSFSIVFLPRVSFFLFGLAILGGVWLVLSLPLFVRALGFLPILVVFLYKLPVPSYGDFEVLALDVGQGSSVVVRTANRTLLYDAGPRFSSNADAGSSTAVPILRGFGRKLDLLMLSHGDLDHAGGAASVLREFGDFARYGQMRFVSSLEAQNVIRKDFSYIPHTSCAAGQSWTWDGVLFEVLFPFGFDENRKSSNKTSCVLKISAGSFEKSALLTGDIGLAQERLLLQRYGDDIRANVLQIPHHGSKTSSGQDFLDMVSPSFALIQSGYLNQFNHPNSDVLARIKHSGAKILNTPQCGAILWQSSNSSQIICHRQREKRFWHWSEK